MDAPNDTPRSQSDQTPQTERPACDESTRGHKDDRLTQDDTDGDRVKQLLDTALCFLSTCSNETLLLVLFCLMGTTYIVFGRLGLLLIGMALGVALHASWVGMDHSNSSENTIIGRKQLSLSIVHKLLNWEGTYPVKADSNAHGAGEDHYRAHSVSDVDVLPLGPITASALHSLIEAAMRDYVK